MRSKIPPQGPPSPEPWQGTDIGAKLDHLIFLTIEQNKRMGAKTKRPIPSSGTGKGYDEFAMMLSHAFNGPRPMPSEMEAPRVYDRSLRAPREEWFEDALPPAGGTDPEKFFADPELGGPEPIPDDPREQLKPVSHGDEPTEAGAPPLVEKYMAEVKPGVYRYETLDQTAARMTKPKKKKRKSRKKS